MSFDMFRPFGPSPCPHCGVAEWMHNCPFKPCRRTDRFWRSIASTFKCLPDRCKPIECTCMKCNFDKITEDNP